MTWVASDKARTVRRLLGEYEGTEWRRCAKDLGLSVEILDLPSDRPAEIRGRRLRVARWLDPIIAAWCAWHEIGHWLLHSGTASFWEARPQGPVTVAKFERQAWDFAILFPVWTDPV